MKKLKIPIIIFSSFWFVAILLWQTKNNIFYIYNFGYIGTAIGIGLSFYVLLPRKKKSSGRRLSQLLVGIYMLCFLGLFKQENMQLEGFFFYLLAGLFSGSAIHYFIAKVIGPVLFGRGFCSWACWTAMVLDFLPYKRPRRGRIAAKWEVLRYIHFGISLSLVFLSWFIFGHQPIHAGISELAWLVAGNILYFTLAIILAFIMQDNRSFCKYLCPITVLLKITSRFSLLKIDGSKGACSQCGACNSACPMNINVMEYINNKERVLSTECIFCLTCTTVCPEKIIDASFKMDIGGKELIHREKNAEQITLR
jgi:polyferredoxin